MSALAMAPETQVGVPDPSVAPLAPVLASSCPGWVCYAEKTVPQALRHVSAVRSGQQVTGAVLKHLLCGSGGLASGDGSGGGDAPRRRVYHVSVQMCFDKKLEASRKDFWWETAATAEVDCVLTSGEVADLLLSAPADLQTTLAAAAAAAAATPTPAADGGAAATPLPPLPPCDDVSGRLAWVEVAMGHAWCWPVAAGGEEGASAQAASDGYSEAVARFLHRARTGTAWRGPLPWVARAKNADFQEAVGGDATAASAAGSVAGSPTFRVMIAYGFRNIQAVVNRLKRAAGGGGAAATLEGVDFVEVMACPSGCVNGGGQVKPLAAAGGELTTASGARTADGMRADAAAGKARLAALRAVLAARDRAQADAGTPPPLWVALFGEGRDAGGWLRGALTRTRYHHVPKMDGLSLAAKW
jgi:hypothetical protein